jgi:RNA polymerase sigma-70 factor (ECF subfamily)
MQDFYAQSYARLVGVVGVVAQDRGKAEDAVQDAFVRLVGQWTRVTAYDNPEAWVLKVALGIMSNHRRKLGRGVKALRRHGPPADVPEPSGDRIDLQRALDRLPRAQREAVVLQNLGLTVEAIAKQLAVPAGTVKSRLSRARKTLVPLLREEASHA